MKQKVTLDDTSYAWKKIADNWENYFFAPSRPSSDETETYLAWLRQIADGKKGLKALVLGATPELRDALNQLHYQTHLIDINIEMILALNHLVEHQNPDEVLIKANWLDNPLQSNYFDVILGDAVFPNIPWDKRVVFYKQIKRLLKPGGIFLNRAFYAPAKKRYKTIDDIFAVFAKKKASNQTAIELVFEIQLLTHDPQDRLGSMEKVKSVVKKLRGNDGFTFKSRELNKTLDILWSYWLGGISNKVWIYPFEREEENEYKKYFLIQNKFSAKDHPYGTITPMYFLKLR